jgi:hypothetical protein
MHLRLFNRVKFLTPVAAKVRVYNIGCHQEALHKSNNGPEDNQDILLRPHTCPPRERM